MPPLIPADPPRFLDPTSLPLGQYLAAGSVLALIVGWFFGPTFMINAMLAVWVARDARERESSTPWVWAGGVLLAGLISYPIYHGTRHLKEEEVRVGGAGWNMVLPFFVLWTLFMLVHGLALFLEARAKLSSVPAEETSQAMVHAASSAVSMGGLWLFVSFLALVVGFQTRKTFIVERGPTGPMARKRAVRIMREQNAELQRQKAEQEKQASEGEEGY